MAKKPAAHAERAEDSPVRICFERILPEELDRERHVRHQLRDQMIASASRNGRRLSADDVAHIARMAVIVSKKWPLGTILRCRFMDGSPSMRKKVEAFAHRWEKYANIKLAFGEDRDAEIRISFKADTGSWSAVGRDALNAGYFPTQQPTMNFGWLRDDTSDTEYSRVVIHEFGHALGCIHEHQQPKFTRKWNVKEVMKYFSGPPNNWSPADIRSNVLEKYSPKGISATEYDPKSIMLYEFDAILFSDGKGPTNTNTKESRKDIRKIGEMYPK
jgi:hypothetical protein